MTALERAVSLQERWMGKKLPLSVQRADIAMAIEAAVAQEREECARLVETFPGRDWYAEADRDPETVEAETAKALAALIRARGEKKA